MLPRAPNGHVRGRAWLLAVVFASLAATGCASAAPAPTHELPVLRIGLALPDFDSNISVGRTVVVHLLSGSRLLRANRGGRYESDVAKSWSVSPDGRTVTLEIRTDARFPDGSPLTPQDVRAVLDETVQSARRRDWPALQNVASVGVAGGNRVILELHEPSSLLLANLDLPITKRTEEGRRVGVGPFSQESESPDRIVLRANPHYHGGAPRIAAIHLRSYPSVRAAWAAMLRGESDFLYSVPNDAREFMERAADVTTIPVLRTNVFSLVFNSGREVFDSATVRRALSMAIDRQAIVGLALRHHGRPATGYLWPSHWAADPAAPSFDYRPVEAFHLLFPSSHGSGPTRPSRVAQGERLQFSCLVPEGVAPHDRIAIVLQKQLFDIGVDMAIEPVPVAELIGRLASGEYDAALLDLSSGASLAPLYPYWHSSGPSFGDLGYDAADAALDALETATTDDQIRSAVSALQQVFYDDPPAIFLCWPETTRALSRRFVIPDPELDLGSSVGRWYPATGVDQGS